jgi:hypothetical protein
MTAATSWTPRGPRPPRSNPTGRSVAARTSLPTTHALRLATLNCFQVLGRLRKHQTPQVCGASKAGGLLFGGSGNRRGAALLRRREKVQHLLFGLWVPEQHEVVVVAAVV